MAISLAAGTSDYLQYTAAHLNPTTVSTVMLWAKFGTVPASPSYSLAYALLDDPGVYTDYTRMTAQTGGSKLNLQFTGPTTIGTTFTPTAGVWYHLCWTQNFASQRFYVNGSLVNTATKDRSAFTIGFEMLGNDTFASGNIQAQYFRSWQSLLNTEQILTEMQSTTAVFASPYRDTPLTSNINDISGNARNWTQVGSGSFVAGPTLPSNSSASTATTISPSGSLTQDFEDGLYGWYTYTGVPADLIVSFWPFATLSDTLTTDCYYGTPGSLTLFSHGVNVPMEVPTSGGDTFYFRVLSSPAQPSTDVVIEGNLRPELTVPTGSIVVNDDGNGDVNGVALPAAFLSSSDGTTLAFAAAVAGESGTVFPPTGQVCLYDVLAGAVNIYPAALGTPTFTIDEDDIHTGGPVKSISSDQTTQFYVGGFQASTTCHVFTLSPDGVVGSTDYAIPITAATNLLVIAPTQDNTVLYYADTGAAAAIRAWDLVNNVALTDLAAGVASHTVGNDILCLADGTILVPYMKITATTDYFIRQYNAAGTILQTFSSFGAGNRIHHLAMAIDDPDSFWVWLYLDDDPGASHGGGVSRFVNVRMSDGTFIQTVDVANFEKGVYNAAPTADPVRMGHSFSCPFWIQRGAVVPPTPGEPEEFLIRRERWFPVLNQENQRMTFSMLQVDLQAGNGLTTGQGSNPLLELDWSDDAGWTWSNIRFLPTGAIGQYNRRAIARLLGQSRQRVFRIAVSDPVQWVILDGYMQVKGGTS